MILQRFFKYVFDSNIFDTSVIELIPDLRKFKQRESVIKKGINKAKSLRSCKVLLSFLAAVLVHHKFSNEIDRLFFCNQT